MMVMNKKNKVVVLVGSLKFWNKIQEVHEKFMWGLNIIFKRENE